MRTTHTLAEMALSPVAYDEVRRKLEAAGYQDAILEEGLLDMQGIALTRDEQLMSVLASDVGPPVPELEGTKSLVLYFSSAAERDDFVRLVQELKPRLQTRSLT